jgi:D-glucuronyl C5-epimerase-like protein
VRSICIALLALLACAAPASASQVLELHGKRVVKRHVSFSGPTNLPTPPPAAPARGKKQAPPSKGRPTRDALDALLASGQIDQATYDAHTATIKRALRAYRKLTGTRKAELAAVIANADSIASAGALTPTRLNPVFLTLQRNTEWWTNGTLLASGKRVTFTGSQLIWQYYPGQGIELQMLANFAQANALWSAKRRTPLRSLIGELLQLGADRGGYTAWEYYFRFGGGAPPWTSSISQGTAVQAIGRAAALLEDPTLNDVVRGALGAFEQPAPAGVRRDTPAGAFYLIYSFAPDLLVLNAHLQAVIGLYDFTQLTSDPRAQALYTAGEAEARVAVPRYDTGRWSLYSLERESDLSYHELVTTFLENLCERTAEPVYCDTAARFGAYLDEAPAVRQSTRRIRAGAPAKVGFSLDKISRVGMTITDSRGRTMLATSAVVGRGSRYFTWRTPAKPGLYTLRLSAKDLAGNSAEPAQGKLRVLRARRAKR